MLAGKLPVPYSLAYALLLLGHLGMLHTFCDKRNIPMMVVNGVGYYENMERRDNVIKKVRSYVKDNNIGGVSVDGWMGGYEVVVFFNRGDEVRVIMIAKCDLKIWKRV